MKFVDINWHPTDAHLRQFGAICLVALPAIGWIWQASVTAIASLAVVGFVFAVVGMAMPKVLKPIFLSLTLVTAPIGMVIGELVMLMIYFGVFLPIGIVFRILKRDALLLRLDRNRTSYWQAKKQPTNMGSYYRQS